MAATQNRGVLTIAFGKAKYIEMAKALARSLERHAPEVPRAVVTDSSDPELHGLFTESIPYRAEYGSNLRQKMHLDLYSPFDETLFIDSDSLVVRGLDLFWEAFRAVPFGACGMRELRAGAADPFLDVDFILRHFELQALPKFNGGVYYFKKSAEASAVCATARELLQRSDELKFTNFRNDGPNDEALYAVAMALHGLRLTDMGTRGMWTPIQATSAVRLDVLAGHCTFEKCGRQLTPDIIHFASFTESFLYLRECLKLQNVARGGKEISAKQERRLRITSAVLRGQAKWAALRQRVRSVAAVILDNVTHREREVSAATRSGR